MKKITSMFILTALVAGLFAGCGGSGFGGGNSNGGGDGGPANGNSGESITVVSRETGSGTRTAFVELFSVEVKDDQGNKKDMTTLDSIIASKTDVMLTNVASDPNAIGYVSLGSLNDRVKALQIDGADASAANIKNGSYTIARPFNIATKGSPNQLARDFIDYILSQDGQTVVANGYVPVDETAAPYAGNRPSGKIVVAGSSSVTPIMEKLAESYMKLNDGAEVEIQMSDSTAGMNGAIEGICDIGMASRDLKDSELEQLTPYTIAMDGIAVIVNKDNPLKGLSKDQVRQIFTGQITAWE